MLIVDVKHHLLDKEILELLALSVFNPTPERVAECAKRYQSDKSLVFTYKENDSYLGIVVFTVSERKAVINNIATSENCRGHGIGSKLIDYIRSNCDIYAIEAETDDDAVNFYRKYGFTVDICGQIGCITRYKCVYRINTACFCGHDCSRCLTYLATINNNEKLRLKSQRFYRDELGLEIPLEKLHCFGGRSQDVFYLCKGCPWMKCCKEKGLSGCSECAEYPCKPLADYQAKYVNKCNQIGEKT